MTFLELIDGYHTYVTGEEIALLQLIMRDERGELNSSELSERGEEVARKLISRGVLSYYFDKQNNKLLFINEYQDIGKF